jgi:hypothetical protein
MAHGLVHQKHKDVAEYIFVPVATLSLAGAGIAGLNRPVLALWAIFGAGVCYALAFQTAGFNKLRHKTPITVGLISFFALATVGAQIWLMQRAPTHNEQARTGDAITHSPASPAVTGSGNTITVNVGATEAVPKKGRRQ